MRLFHALASCQLLATRLVAAVPLDSQPASTINIDPTVGPLEALAQLQQHAYETLKQRESVSKRDSKGCSLATATIRKGWQVMHRNLLSFDRKAYIEAVQCLRRLPPKSDPSWAPAAKNRFDDFVAIHVNQTLYIHGNGLFLTWHRYFVWAYEQALRDECGYKGYQPYWDWFAHADNIYESPVFDGSDTSLGGDGEFFAHNGSLAGGRLIPIPSGQGGGCVKSGPFKNMQANIGPISPGMQGLNDLATGITDHNPHCLRRDLSPYIPKKWFTTENLLNVTIGAGSVTHPIFWQEIQGRYTDGFLGLHASGHYTMGGDATDLYSSVNDPAFFLHHTMLDRIYWIWQVLHPAEASKVTGTLTLQNKPPTRNATIDEPLEMGINGATLKIRDMFNTLGGTPLCYIYL
ncbi:hypothetical protein COCC4DRAFT_124481 [Bipolaris maydis ATCC 48331]|uniref:Tyrosinase copper-binding domain-containing protein n=2 Tax=Cochliobolus heterostrophus TaxID=5016 RepID=M2TEH8_COCH5|nr:uncharacterized protein COCC4DRAFT_124481 [Bipolaris maydis ATCC 48331]EMD95855.1 hypothetical protein COCHEDRAFT_59870 [Bipolaris maydis C5]ENI10715.1 hypothetical protein COCC4DRAFT_124481 [Bipolaris maydis ATCC 48331]KAJ5030571.1 hypothetical protein J3E73DRAFT_388219 [Bipolaris maydis]KAJ6274589.1 hypothetical protein PSV08DRAFT_368121 [Bipolaris maydis]